MEAFHKEEYCHDKNVVSVVLPANRCISSGGIILLMVPSWRSAQVELGLAGTSSQPNR
jgi:hypothetical protein